MNTETHIDKAKLLTSNLKIQIFKKSVFICIHLWIICPLTAQNIPCKFNEKTLQFVGIPIEQARCLLRPNRIGGVLGEQLKVLPRRCRNSICAWQSGR